MLNFVFFFHPALNATQRMRSAPYGGAGQRDDDTLFYEYESFMGIVPNSLFPPCLTPRLTATTVPSPTAHFIRTATIPRGCTQNRRRKSTTSLPAASAAEISGLDTVWMHLVPANALSHQLSPHNSPSKICSSTTTPASTVSATPTARWIMQRPRPIPCVLLYFTSAQNMSHTILRPFPPADQGLRLQRHLSPSGTELCWRTGPIGAVHTGPPARVAIGLPHAAAVRRPAAGTPPVAVGWPHAGGAPLWRQRCSSARAGLPFCLIHSGRLAHVHQR